MSRARALAAVEAEVGEGESLEPLTESDLKALTALVQVAKKRQSAALKDAINQGMSFVPALLRIPLKKILFP